MTGGFSRAIHYIESAKGWSTEYIMGLPLCRMRQVLELIIQSQRDEHKFMAQLTEWQTKNIIAAFTVAARDPKQAKAIVQMANKLKLPLADEVQADIVDDRPFDEVVEQGAKVDMTEQPSFEALEAAFRQL